MALGKRRFSRTIAAALSLGVCLPALGQSHPIAPVGEFVPMRIDSGVLANPGAGPACVFERLVTAPEGAWLRLYFDSASLPEGSFLRVMSLRDGEFQDLSAQTLSQWSMSTAYFNGDAVVLQLFAAGGTASNRVVLEKVATQYAHAGGADAECGICTVDTRTPSSEPHAGRLMPVGCSGSIFCPDGALVSAGHCAGSGQVIQFNVPASLSNCALVNPPVADQFPVTYRASENAGVGADWAVMTSGVNNLGQTIFQRYGEYRPILVGFPTAGNPIFIYGYGADDECVRNQVQQYSPGVMSSVGSTSYGFSNDVRGGSSGSSILYLNQITGIVTHCTTMCVNYGTRVDKANFDTARAAWSACTSPTYTVTIASSPATALAVAVSPTDVLGAGNGTTQFKRYLKRGVTYSLTAPANDPAGRCFQKWQRNGVDFTTSRTAALTFFNHTTMTAVYVDCPPACCVDYNGDTEIDFSDIEMFLAALAAQAPGNCAPGADLNNDGEWDFSDIETFIALYTAGC